jgi:monoterpene epsilon-lactone hydrolase
MSLRAEALRFALRRLSKGRDHERPDIAAIRRNLKNISRFIPGPPKGTDAARIDAGGVQAIQVATPRSRRDRHVLYLHGGGYNYGSPALYRDFIWRIADVTEARVLCLDYRLAPEYPFPAALDDAVGAYRWLLTEGAAPGRMAIMGDSAGGGLTFGTLLRLRDELVPLPAAAAGLSPWTDLSLSGPSVRTNASVDPMLNATQARFLADDYLGGADPAHPYASPLFGDPTGLPPSLLQVGSDEILRDDAALMAERMRGAGCAAELEIWPRMPHVWQLYARFLPEARQAVERIGRFITQQMNSK